MRFPKVIRFRRVEATIYGKTKKCPFYQLAYYVAGKRMTRGFKAEAERLVRQIPNGPQAAALAGEQSCDVLAAIQRLESFHRSAGRRFSLLAAMRSKTFLRLVQAPLISAVIRSSEVAPALTSDGSVRD